MSRKPPFTPDEAFLSLCRAWARQIRPGSRGDTIEDAVVCSVFSAGLRLALTEPAYARRLLAGARNDDTGADVVAAIVRHYPLDAEAVRDG